MILRVPVMGKLPSLLIRNTRPPPTPVIDGVVAPPVASLLERGSWSDKEQAAVVQLAGVSPETDPTWSKTYPALLANSCAFFASEVIRGPKKKPYNGKFLLGRHHLEWDKLIMDHRRLNILAARDHGKSFYFTMAYPIWKAGYNLPGSTGVIFSATQPQAEEFLGMIKRELLENPKLAHLVPYTRDRFWSAKKITLRNGSVIRAAGFGVKIRGGHPNWVVCDDVLNDDDIYSETIRRRNVDYFLSAIAGMVHVEDQLIVVGTPMHHGDLYGVLADQESVLGLLKDIDEEDLKGYTYECRKYPARDAQTGELLFPERYNERALMLKRIELKSAARFAREFLCQPLSDEASLFPSKLFEGADVRLPYKLGMPASYWEERGFLRYSGVDIALSAETGGDYFVIFTAAVNAQGERWIANIRRGRGWSFTRQIDAIKDEYYLLRPEMIHIESNQMQRVWTDEIARTTDIPVRRFFTTGVGGRQPENAWRKGATQVSVNKHHLDRGVPALRITLEHRKWRIPRGDENAIKMTDIWIGEMGAIGWIDGKVQSVADHDDVVMACWMCDTAIRMGGTADMEFLNTTAKAPVAVLAAPVPPSSTVSPGDVAAAEQHALASIQQGGRVEVERGLYIAHVRQAIHSYAGNSVDVGEHPRAVRALQEIKRLDALYSVRASDVDVANRRVAEYRQVDGWKPAEGSPTPGDFGVAE